MEPGGALGRVSAGRSDCEVSSSAWCRWIAAEVCLHGDAGRRLLLRLQSAHVPASAEPACDGDGREAAGADPWRTDTVTYADQVRLQTNQADRADRVHGHAAG